MDVSGAEVQELTGEIRLLTQEISSLKQKLEEATVSLSRCHERLDEITTAVAATDNRVKKLEERDREMVDLSATVAHLQSEMNSMAQNHLQNELEITGVSENENENLHHIILVAARKIGVDLDDADIDWIHRVGPRRISGDQSDNIAKLPRPVVVRITRKAKRDQLLKAAKSRRNITSSDLEVPGTTRKIYYNERLTKENRMLFRDARSKTKQCNYAQCFCSQGKIYIRKQNGRPAILVRSVADLDSIAPSVIAN